MQRKLTVNWGIKAILPSIDDGCFRTSLAAIQTRYISAHGERASFADKISAAEKLRPVPAHSNLSHHDSIIMGKRGKKVCVAF